MHPNQESPICISSFSNTSPWERWSIFKNAVDLEEENPEQALLIHQDLAAIGMVHALRHIPKDKRSDSQHRTCSAFYWALLYSNDLGSNNYKIRNKDWSLFARFQRILKQNGSLLKDLESLTLDGLMHKLKKSRKFFDKRLLREVPNFSSHPLLLHQVACHFKDTNNLEKALDNFKIASENGNLESLAPYVTLSKDLGRKLDPEHHYLFIAMQINEIDPHAKICQNYYEGKKPFEKSSIKASKALKIGSETGGMHAQKKYIPTLNHQKENFPFIYPHLTAAANQGCLEAQTNLFLHLKNKVEQTQKDDPYLKVFQEHIDLLAQQLECHKNHPFTLDSVVKLNFPIEQGI